MSSPAKRLSSAINGSPDLGDTEGFEEGSKKRKVTESQQDINAVISQLALPVQDIQVALDYANNKNSDLEVQAYAKLAGSTWTYYVQTLKVMIGRASDPTDEHSEIQVDLGPAKVVSRKHAMIQYNIPQRYWELIVLGRNGVKIDRISQKKDTTVQLYSGNVLDIGGVQMMFVLPDVVPRISPGIVKYLERTRTSNNSVPQGAGALSSSLPTEELSTVNSTISTSFSSHVAPSNSSSSLIRPPRPDEQQRQNQPLPPSIITQPPLAYPKGVAIITRPQVRGIMQSSQYTDSDLSIDDAKDIKPPYSYATMITQAILSTRDHQMSLSDIYDYISTHYSFYRHSKSGWQNSIRHNLSLNKAFEKVPRRADEPGKGMKWKISDPYRDEFIKKATQAESLTGAIQYQRRIQLHQSPPKARESVIQFNNTGSSFTSSAAATAVSNTDTSSASNQHPQQITSPGGLRNVANTTTTPQKVGSMGAPTSAVRMGYLDFLDQSAPFTDIYTPGKQTGLSNSAAISPVDRYMSSQVSQLEAYTPERGRGRSSQGTVSGSGSGGGSRAPLSPDSTVPEFTAPTPNEGARNKGSIRQQLANMSGAGKLLVNNIKSPNAGTLGSLSATTPAHPHHPQLIAPTSAQQQQLPSSFMPASSPAPFWRFMQLSSTPVKASDFSPSKYSSPPDHRQGDSGDGLGDLQDVDLTRGFRQIGKWRDGITSSEGTPEKAVNG